jgi:hypothetical protein
MGSDLPPGAGTSPTIHISVAHQDYIVPLEVACEEMGALQRPRVGLVAAMSRRSAGPFARA